jgi:hypothetical protein
VPLGFEPERALTLNIALQGQRFNRGTLDEARAARLEFYHQLLAAVEQIPGVEQVGVGLPVPLNGTSLVQRYSAAPGQPERQAEAAIALGGYLEALRVPLVAGRYFTRADDMQPVAIIDQRLAAEVWGDRSPLGQRLALLSAVGPPRWVEIVGVTAHVQTQGLRTPGLPQIWMTYVSKSYSGLDLIVRGSNPAGFIAPVKEAVQRLGAGRPVHDVRVLSDYVAAASADTRFALFVLGAFALLAVTLTTIGVYAVVAYATAQRRREIAVRLALGADPSRIASLVIRQGAVWIGAGLLAGIVGARLLTGYLAGLLFRVTQHDAITFACVAAGLATVALLATAIPALRAARVDPMLSLKAE